MSADLLAAAEEAARAAGALLLERFEAGRGAAGAVSAKSTPTDLVSEADLAAEAAIRSVLRERRPDDAIVGEEGEDVAGTSGLRWVVDPLDGTINFLFGIPMWCVSVACEGHAGVIYDPSREELFAVANGSPPTLNGTPLRLGGQSPRSQMRLEGQTSPIGTALVATGFGYDAAVRAAQAEVVARVLPRVRDIRRAGSAALDLAWTAAGRLDAYYEFGVQHWDIAAGTLLCEAAGLEVRRLQGRGALPAGILAAPPGLASELAALVDA